MNDVERTPYSQILSEKLLKRIDIYSHYLFTLPDLPIGTGEFIFGNGLADIFRSLNLRFSH